MSGKADDGKRMNEAVQAIQWFAELIAGVEPFTIGIATERLRKLGWDVRKVDETQEQRSNA